MSIKSHIFAFPKAGTGGGGGGPGAPIGDGWIWQDESNHEWQDGAEAIWCPDAGGGGAAGTILFEDGEDILWEDGDDITWES